MLSMCYPKLEEMVHKFAISGLASIMSSDMTVQPNATFSADGCFEGQSNMSDVREVLELERKRQEPQNEEGLF